MSKNNHALDTHIKHEHGTRMYWLRLLARALVFYVVLTVALLLISNSLIQLALALRATNSTEIGWEVLIIWRVVIWSALWFQLWLYGSVLRLKLLTLRRALTIVVLTMGTWEVLLLALLRIFGNTVFLVGNGVGTLSLLVLAIFLGTMLTSRYFAISIKQSLVLVILSVLGVVPLFYSFMFIGSSVMAVVSK